MKTVFIVFTVGVFGATTAGAQGYWPDGRGGAWYPRPYGIPGYYHGIDYGRGLAQSCYDFGCYARPGYGYGPPRFSWHYARPHYQEFHYRRADRDGWAYNRGFGRW